MSNLDLPALKKLCEAATPGPDLKCNKCLGTGEFLDANKSIGSPFPCYRICHCIKNQSKELDEKIRTAVPQLIERVGFLEGRLKESDLGWKRDWEENTALKAEVERLEGLNSAFMEGSEDAQEEALNHSKENQALRELLGEANESYVQKCGCGLKTRIDAALGEK